MGDGARERNAEEGKEVKAVARSKVRQLGGRMAWDGCLTES